MARPRKVGLDYFPHDVDVTTDPKLEPLILRYGSPAYALYFVILEYCYRAEDLSVDISASETGEEMREVLQRKLHIAPDLFDELVAAMLRRGAFDAKTYKKGGLLTSAGIQKRASKVLEKRIKALERYQRVSTAETGPQTDQSKEKYSKAKPMLGVAKNDLEFIS